jgi:hypothetical protein
MLRSFNQSGYVEFYCSSVSSSQCHSNNALHQFTSSNVLLPEKQVCPACGAFDETYAVLTMGRINIEKYLLPIFMRRLVKRLHV